MAVDTDLRARREAILHEHVAAENRHDPAATVATFGGQARYDVPALGPLGQMDGDDAVHGFLAGMFVSFPDFHGEPGPFHHADSAIFMEVQVTGTQQGEFAGIPPSGRQSHSPLSDSRPCSGCLAIVDSPAVVLRQ